MHYDFKPAGVREMVSLVAGILISLAADTLAVAKTDSLDAACVTSFASLTVPQQSLNGEDLRILSTTGVAEAIKYFAGVQIKDFGGLGGQKTVNVRSLGTQHTGVFIDGIRITNCQNGTVDLGKYSLMNMESVEVYNSNKIAPLMTASEYASGSTIYLKTRRPERTSLSARYSYGSFNTHKAQVHASLRRSLFADVEVDHSDGNYPFVYKTRYEDTTGVRRNSDITFFRAEGGWFNDRISTHAYVYSSERGLPGGIVQRLSDQFGDIGRESDINTFVQASYTDSWGCHAFKANARYAYDYLHANTDFPENQFIRYNNKYIQQDFYAGAAYSYATRMLTLSVSPDVRFSDLSCNVYGMSYVARCDFKTVADVRFKWRFIDLDASLLYTFVKDFSKMQTADPLQRFTPCAYASFKIAGGLSARAFYKSVFRAPTLNDLYYTHVGKRSLKPESTDQLDFGLAYADRHWNVQTDYYHNAVRDKIICIPNGGSYDWKMMNRGFVRTDGVDVSARYSHEYFSVFVTGTWQNVRDLSDPEDECSYNHQLLYSPEWSVSAVLSGYFKGFSASLSHMFCSRRYWSYASEEDILPQYNCTDAKVQYTWKWLTFCVECNDIFNVHYEIVQRWPMPGRRFAASLTFNIEKKNQHISKHHGN